MGNIPSQPPGARSCAAPIQAPGVTRFALHFVYDGPAGVTVEAQVERADVAMP